MWVLWFWVDKGIKADCRASLAMTTLLRETPGLVRTARNDDLFAAAACPAHFVLLLGLRAVGWAEGIYIIEGILVGEELVEIL